MILIGGGFDREFLKKQIDKMSGEPSQIDLISFNERIKEIFGRLGGKQKQPEKGKPKAHRLTPEELEQAEILRRRVRAILDHPSTGKAA